MRLSARHRKYHMTQHVTRHRAESIFSRGMDQSKQSRSCGVYPVCLHPVHRARTVGSQAPISMQPPRAQKRARNTAGTSHVGGGRGRHKDDCCVKTVGYGLFKPKSTIRNGGVAAVGLDHDHRVPGPRKVGCRPAMRCDGNQNGRPWQRVNPGI